MLASRSAGSRCLRRPRSRAMYSPSVFCPIRRNMSGATFSVVSVAFGVTRSSVTVDCAFSVKV